MLEFVGKDGLDFELGLELFNGVVDFGDDFLEVVLVAILVGVELEDAFG